jgi:GNAT superfamily N-acetyltransferase
VLTGQTPGAAAAAGFRRLLADPAHRVVLAVLPGPNAPDGGAGSGEVTVGLAVLGVDPLSVVLGVPQVTVDNLVVHRDHRRCGAGAALLAAAVAYASSVVPRTSSGPSAGTRPSGSGSSRGWGSCR